MRQITISACILAMLMLFTGCSAVISDRLDLDCLKTEQDRCEATL